MNALVLHKYGGVEELMYESIPKPTVSSPLDIVIQTKAIGVNAADYKMREGMLKSLVKLPFPLVLGMDFAGIVTEVGDKVSKVKVGDAVYGRMHMPQQYGAYAEYIKIDESKATVMKKPDSLSWEVAGGLGVPVTTAYTSLVEHGKLTKGDKKRVLVIGASGGVGYWTVQLAKAMEAHVTGICSTRNIDYVKSIGADHVIDYTKNNIPEELKKVDVFDIIVDCVGGDDYWRMTEPFLKAKGVFSTAMGPNNHIENLNLGSLAAPLLKYAWRSVIGRTTYKWILQLPPVFPEQLNGWFENGTVKPITTHSYPLKEGRQAHEQSASGRTVGKIVLVP